MPLATAYCCALRNKFFSNFSSVEFIFFVLFTLSSSCVPRRFPLSHFVRVNSRGTLPNCPWIDFLVRKKFEIFGNLTRALSKTPRSSVRTKQQLKTKLAIFNVSICANCGWLLARSSIAIVSLILPPFKLRLRFWKQLSSMIINKGIFAIEYCCWLAFRLLLIQLFS